MNLKILIFDGSFKTTAFINRLAAGLAKRHQVYIAGFNEELPRPVTGVTYVPLAATKIKNALPLRHSTGQGKAKELLLEAP